MAESVARSSTTSATSAVRLRVSKRSARTDQKAVKAGEREETFSSLFAELARLAEMSAVERELREFGFRSIAGTDEVGRGALAGPVVAAAVILPRDMPPFRVNDSKLISSVDRHSLCSRIMQQAVAVAIGVIEPQTIDRINILRASKLAMREAVENLSVRPDVLLLDAVVVERFEIPQVAIISGDRRSTSIAAASIVAKVYRDVLMESYDSLYPGYGFSHHRGYGTELHWKALRDLGPSPIHRKTFEGVSEPLLFERKRENGRPTR